MLPQLGAAARTAPIFDMDVGRAGREDATSALRLPPNFARQSNQGLPRRVRFGQGCTPGSHGRDLHRSWSPFVESSTQWSVRPTKGVRYVTPEESLDGSGGADRRRRGALATQAASAATPACGASCLSMFSPELGTYASPNFVEHVFGGRARIGTQTGLARPTALTRRKTSSTRIRNGCGRRRDGPGVGRVNRDYAPLTASQLKYTPEGIPTGLCVGVAIDPFQGEPLSLQSCPIPGRTVWVIDTADSPATAAHRFVPDRERRDERFRPPVHDDLPAPCRHGGDASADPPSPPGVSRPRADRA